MGEDVDIGVGKQEINGANTTSKDIHDLEDYGPNANIKKLGLTENEKQLFGKYKGLKFKLSTEIAEVFGVSANNIEIGCVQITKYGIIIHIVHYVYNSDLDELEEQSNGAISICASFFTQQLYANCITEINQIFRINLM